MARQRRSSSQSSRKIKIKRKRSKASSTNCCFTMVLGKRECCGRAQDEVLQLDIEINNEFAFRGEQNVVAITKW